MSDILAIRKGKFIGCEGKTDDNKESKKRGGTLEAPKGSAMQEIFGENISLHGGFYICFNMHSIKSGKFEQWLAGIEAL